MIEQIMNDDAFRQILNYLDLSWSGYRKVRKGVKRRLQRHMQVLGIRKVDDYRELLSTNRHVRHRCEHLMMVTVTRFFRDQRFWQLLPHIWLPYLVQRFGQLRLWSAGCAGGEEVYSLVLIWLEAIRKQLIMPKALAVLGTDADYRNLRRAQAACYQDGSLKAVPAAIRERYFRRCAFSDCYTFAPGIPLPIQFQRHEFSFPLPEPWPADGFQLLLVRNSILTYYRKPLCDHLLAGLLHYLEPGGLLVVGARETVSIATHHVHPCPQLPFVYIKGA